MLVLDLKSEINGKLNKLAFKRNFRGPLSSLLHKQHRARA